MAGTQLRQMGTTAQFAPVIKRGIATLTDGRTVTLAVDTNLASSSGTDVTGVAKIHLYVSNDVSRTAFTLATSLTPAVAPSSSTRAARASMSLGADNSIWVAWQGVDNALYVTKWTYSAGTVTFSATETVVAAGGITDRFRSVDIDVTGNSSVAVGVYEAQATSGAGAFLRVYVRNNSASWVRALSFENLNTGGFIRTNSEDVSVAWRGDGIVSNVGRLLLYGTRVYSTVDVGDLVREYSYNVSTGTTDSATNVGTWATEFNKDQAAGTRRGMIFTLNTTLYLLAGVIGAGVPKFFATKLTTGNYTAPVVSTAGYVSTISLSNYFKIDPTANARTYWSASYKDNRLLFGFAGVGSGDAPRIYREVSMSWAAVGTATAKPTIDAIPRPLDSAFYGDGGPIAIYGGDNRRTQASLKYYNFVGLYGPAGNTVSTTIPRRLRFVSEDTFDAPTLLSPYYVEPTSRPTYRVRVDNVNLQPNLYGKIEVNVASNSIFTTSLKTIIQPDSEFQYFGSQDGLSGGSKQVAIATQDASQALTQGTWYWRARVVSDKDSPGAWSTTTSFAVSHPPSALAISPTPASVVAFTSANSYTFTWTRSDTEPTDTQTAYALIVRRLDTVTNIVSTGYVSSSANTVSVTIDAVTLGVVDVPLDWSVQLKDADGVAGAASDPVQFTIGNKATLDIIYPDGVTVVDTALPTFTWTFTGFGLRTQKAYRVSVYDNTTPNLLTNASFESGMTGWGQVDGTAVQSSTQFKRGGFSAFITPNGSGVTPSVVSAIGNRPAVNPGESRTVEGWVRPTTANKPALIGINWYDASNVFISASTTTVAALAGTWQYLTLTAVAPVGAATCALVAGVTSTPAGTDTAYVDQLSLHLPSVAATTTLLDSYWQEGAAVSYTPPSQVLVDNGQYGVTVQVQDTGGLITETTEYFTTNWTGPSLASGLVVTTPNEFKVNVAWTNAGQDSDWVGYRVYRRYMKTSIAAFDIDNTATTWYLMFETTEVLTNYSFDDYLAPLNVAVDYVVVQMADRFGSLIESDITTFQTVTLTTDRYYFVPQVLLGGIVSFQAASVTGDNFSREIEQETLHVIGRGRQVQVGDDLGYSGTLSIKQRNPATARRDREFFELISAQYNSVYIKTPFGDVVLIALGNIQSSRIPGFGGHADFVDITVPYLQIIDEELTTRSATI